MTTHNSRRFTPRDILLSAAIFAALNMLALDAQSQDKVGTLSTSIGDSITDTQLADWIDELIPPATSGQRLIVLTECFGGDKVDNFAGKANTAVISATSPGETATYGGYDDDAAAALKPGATNTGATVHAAGSGDAKATPTTGGGLAPGGFSLAPVATPTDMIESRHVLVYAGQPDGGGGTTDVMQRDTIKANFAGDATVTTVGGAGGGGWDHPGSAKGLRAALKAIGDDIANDPMPTKEQFILFVTDHGDLHKKDANNTITVPSCGALCLPTPYSSSFDGFDSLLDLDPQILFDDPDNEPGLSIFVDLWQYNQDNPGGEILIPDGSPPFFSPGEWQLTVNSSNTGHI